MNNKNEKKKLPIFPQKSINSVSFEHTAMLLKENEIGFEYHTYQCYDGK